MPTERCAGCGALCGPTYASQVARPTPDGRGQLCGPCVVALQRVMRREGLDPRAAWARWRRGGADPALVPVRRAPTPTPLQVERAARIAELAGQGLSISELARRVGADRKVIRRLLGARGS